jgi:hypothetical protein
MPYPESCPECGGAFRNTGTHFTARRNEVGRHVLLELGCQNTSRRFWWDFTSGNLTDDGQTSARRLAAAGALSSAAATNGSHHPTNGHTSVATIDEELVVSRPTAPTFEAEPPREPQEVLFVEDPHPLVPSLTDTDLTAAIDVRLEAAVIDSAALDRSTLETSTLETDALDLTNPETTIEDAADAPSELAVADAEPISLPGPPPASLKDAFVRQLQLDRLTLRQMRSWLMSDEARRAIEVAAGATEATYERLALILFGADLPQLLGKQAPVPASTVMSAEERLELQREKARIRARLRRAAAKAARQGSN